MPTPQPVSVELYLSGAWTPVTPLDQLTFSDDPIEIVRGFDASGKSQPSKIALTFNNDDNRFDPDDPTGPLYGIAGRNTPIRIKMSGAELQRAELSSYAIENTADHVRGANRGRAQVAVVAEGLLRRLGRWTDQVRSPMYSIISARTTSIGHWPLEENADATALTNTLDGGQAGFAGGVTFGDDDAPAGAAQSIKTSATSGLSGIFRKVPATNAGWQIAWSMKLNAIPPAVLMPVLSWTTSNGYRWWWDVDNGGYRLTCRDRDNTLLMSQTVLYGTGAEPNQWITFRVKATATAGTVTAEMAWYPQGASVLYGISPTFSGTTGALATWIITGNTHITDAHYSHIFGVQTGADNLQSSTALHAFDGYVGEPAGTRFARLTALFGITRYAVGSLTDTVPMGAQKPGTFLESLQECAVTDDALIYDTSDDIALTWVSRKARYNQTVALALTYPGDVGPPLRKVIDDPNIANSVTVKNVRGGEATAVRTTGPMSILAPPAGVGEYKGGDVTINADSDSRLPYRAGWELAKGTILGARYPIVRVDVLNNPGLATACQNLDPGEIITITAKAPEVIRLFMIQASQIIGHITRVFEFICAPADVWYPAKYDDTTTRYDSRASTLQTARTTTQTAWTALFPGLADQWTVRPASIPFDLLVAGERVRVTAVGAVAGTAGAYTQALTVTRSINGVIKAQLAGAELHVADVARYAL
jgi:hypothetical protein